MVPLSLKKAPQTVILSSPYMCHPESFYTWSSRTEFDEGGGKILRLSLIKWPMVCGERPQWISPLSTLLGGSRGPGVPVGADNVPNSG